MSPIDTSELHKALCSLRLDCREPQSIQIGNLSELSRELGWMFADLPQDLMVPDPAGRADFGFFFQPATAFERNLLLLHDSQVMFLGHNGGGGVLFVSAIHDGRVGLLFDVPDDMFTVDFTASEDRIIFWQEEFLDWVRMYRKHGLTYIDEPGSDFA